MDINQAKQIAEELMHKHLDFPMLWTFEFRNARRYFGCCRYRKLVFKGREFAIPGGVITISRPLTELNSQEEFRDTILHEIAHALCGPGVGHSEQWKETARRLGCRAESRCDSSNVKVPPPRYIAECPNCGRQRGFDRIKVMSCGRCDNKFNQAYRMVFRRNQLATNRAGGIERIVKCQ